MKSKNSKKKTVTVILMLLGLSFILVSLNPFDLFGVILGAVLIFFGYFRIRKPNLKNKKDQAVQSNKVKDIPVKDIPVKDIPAKTTEYKLPDMQPLETYTFGVTGFRYPCKFPSAIISKRQDAIECVKVGEIVSLHPYEWRGADAYAVVPCDLLCDIGVVPAIDISNVVSLSEIYDVMGYISNIYTANVEGKDYETCDITLNCYEKGTVYK